MSPLNKYHDLESSHENNKGKTMEDKLRQMRARKKKESDLSDIVLEKESKNAANTKKWLLTAASAILLFLIVLVVMKMLNKPGIGTQENISSVGEKVETLTPNNAQDDTAAVEKDIFKKEPIINENVDESSETDLKFEEMVRKLKEQDKVNESAPQELANEKQLDDSVKEVKKQMIKPVIEVVGESPVKPAQATKPTQTTQATAPNIAKVTPVQKQKTKTVAAPAAVATPSQPSAPVAKQTNVSKISGYFIQVGATAKSFPEKSFLQKVKRAGFDYIVHSVTIKGKKIKKVLVGPYTKREDAANALPAVKSSLNPSAYIYQVN